LPAFDFHCPLASLPLAFETALDTIPAAASLRVPADRLAMWERHFADIKRPKVGVVWAGRAAHANDQNRSIPLRRLSAILANPEIQFVSLQRELREEDAATLRAHPRIIHLGDSLHDFADTAAVLSLLDGVISVDTSVAHLAGISAGCSSARILPGIRARSCFDSRASAIGTASSSASAPRCTYLCSRRSRDP
jgi:hypothetical protein